MFLCGGDSNVVGDYNMVMMVPMSTMAVMVAILMAIVVLGRMVVVVSQRALRRRARARLTGALSNGGRMRGGATNVYLWKTSGKPKETGQNENSKFGSCIYV